VRRYGAALSCPLRNRTDDTTIRSSTPPNAKATLLDAKAVEALPTVTYHEDVSPQNPANEHRSCSSIQTARWKWTPYQCLPHANLKTIQGREQRGCAGFGEKSCAVCTEDLTEGSQVRRLPCGHCFHPVCIESWLLGFATTCPSWCDAQNSGCLVGLC